MDSELLLKFIGYFPAYLSALSRTFLRCFWTTFVETAVWVRQVNARSVPYEFAAKCEICTFSGYVCKGPSTSLFSR